MLSWPRVSHPGTSETLRPAPCEHVGQPREARAMLGDASARGGKLLVFGEAGRAVHLDVATVHVRVGVQLRLDDGRRCGVRSRRAGRACSASATTVPIVRTSARSVRRLPVLRRFLRALLVRLHRGADDHHLVQQVEPERRAEHGGERGEAPSRRAARRRRPTAARSFYRPQGSPMRRARRACRHGKVSRASSQPIGSRSESSAARARAYCTWLPPLTNDESRATASAWATSVARSTSSRKR